MNPADFESAARRRDARLRWRMLSLLFNARGGDAGGFVSGRLLCDLFGPESGNADCATDETHLVALLRDLTLKGLLAERDERTLRRQPFSLDTLRFRVTAAGIAFVTQSAPADADIDDGRIAPSTPRT